MTDNIDDFVRRFNQVANAVNRNVGGGTPTMTPTVISEDPTSAHKRRLEQIARAPIKRKIGGLDTILAGFGTGTAQATAGKKSNWNDLEPGKRAFVQLMKFQKEDGEEDDVNANIRLLTYAKDAFEEMMTEFSASTVAKILIVAYNLKDRNGRELFGEVPVELCDATKELDPTELDTMPLQEAYESNPIRESVAKDDESYLNKVVTSYCFYACSVLRVAGKPPENYTRAIQQITRGFRNFYNYDIALSGFSPSLGVMEAVKNLLSNHEVLRHTLYTLIYAGESVETGKSLKSFLYSLHLKYTGMHPFTVFDQCAEAYDTSPLDLAKCLRYPRFEPVLDALLHLYENFINIDLTTNQEKKLGMWKYARIFDHECFSELQTKKNIMFTATIARLVNLEKPQTGDGRPNILHIAQIKNLPKPAAQVSDDIAKRTRAIILSLKGKTKT